MKPEEIEKRDQILYELWERYKGEMTMKSLAELLGIPLVKYWRAVQRIAKKKVEEKEGK
jgi:DNA-directed RNA polymerase specialized sigma subunit